MVKIGIIGISGYSGCALLEILLQHPQVRITNVAANQTRGPVAEIWPQFLNRTDLICGNINIKQIQSDCDLVFLAVPHTASLEITPKLIAAGIKVIDISGDYRLKNTALYEKWYGHRHTDSKNLKHAVYGLPEINRVKIGSAKLIANPGCYPTAASLGLIPVVSTYPKAITSIIIDAKSGVTGAGKKAATELLFSEINESFKAYKVLAHQHSPEIEQTLSGIAGRPVKINFVPHLIPVQRGIFETIYVQLKEKVDLEKFHALYKKFYKTEPFVRVLPPGKQPELKFVNYTNFCDIGLVTNEANDLLVVTSAIDNLVKGAAGQAVQNMNIMCRFDEITALL